MHPDWWWQARFEALGFHYSKELTELVRLQANNEKNRVRGQPVGQHIRLSMQGRIVNQLFKYMCYNLP